MTAAKDILALLVSLATLVGLILHCMRDKQRFTKLFRSRAEK
jgi:hypothetical protein